MSLLTNLSRLKLKKNNYRYRLKLSKERKKFETWKPVRDMEPISDASTIIFILFANIKTTND